MKALRYLLSIIAVVSVLGVSAHTPTYGTTYKGQETLWGYTVAQMPAATMGSVNAGYMQSNTTLPFAAESGVTTTYDKNYAPSRPRREGENEGFEDEEENTNIGEPFPLGDGLLPMMLLAAMYFIVRIARKRRYTGMVR